MSKPTIKLGNITVPADLKGKDLLKFLVENKSLLISEKKSDIKRADAIAIGCDIGKAYYVDKDGKLNKATNESKPEVNGPETVLCVINTTNWLDSHGDVHIPGLWKKSLSDNPIQLHLQEHDLAFDHVISDESKAYTERIAWKKLGYDLAGQTEALIFATPFTGRNSYMEEQYRKGFVKNHSVGMRYVVIKLCVNEADDEYFKEEYSNWVQYAPQVVNIEDAEKQGYFWAVLEAKVIEGSAVVKGSNIITPTLGFKSAQPAPTTETNEPPSGTQEKEEETDNGGWDKISSALEKAIII
jgi:hypothetical protein